MSWQYCGEKPALADDGTIADFTKKKKMLLLIHLKLKKK